MRLGLAGGGVAGGMADGVAATDRHAALLCGVGQAYRPRWIIIAGFLMMLVVGLLAFAALLQFATSLPPTSAAAGKVWTAASQRVRTPLGEMLSRTFLAQENLPAPPAGYDVLKFRTRFANRADALETVTLDREDGAWRVVDVTIA